MSNSMGEIKVLIKNPNTEKWVEVQDFNSESIEVNKPTDEEITESINNR